MHSPATELPMATELPVATVKAIRKTFAETGDDWIQNYPTLLNSYLERWELTITGVASGGWPTNLVYFVQTRAGESLVLKMGHPHPESKTEVLALDLYQEVDAPVARPLERDDAGYGLLLERLVPGETLRDHIRDEAAIKNALQLHRDLPKRATPEGLPRFDEWLTGAFAEYRAGTSIDPQFLVHIELAESLFESFRHEPDCLLHGDCHHENILLDGGRWKAIDPKGVIGPAIIESGRFLHNFIKDERDTPLEHQDRIDILQRRCQLAAEVLGYSAQSLAQVAFIDATLATCWSVNSGGEVAEGFAILAALKPLLSGSSVS
ncbi:MAG: streptomycin 6-kinase [Candidatus Azotimanducaceae bacterium]|jgi:streptomycin 6-kinase